MQIVDRAVGWVDRRQRAFTPAAFVVGVIKKYGDDRGGSLSALVTFYGFLAVFPLLLLFVTVVGMIVGPSSPTEKAIVASALSQFPVIGTHLDENIHALSRGNPLAFVVSAVGLLWGSLGITNSVQQASARMWGVPRSQEPGLWARVLRSLMLLGVMGASVVLSSVLAGVSTIGHSLSGGQQALLQGLTLAGAAALNVAAYFVALRILAPPGTPARRLLPGTAFGGLAWTALQAAGGYLIGHQLHRATVLYGFFAIVLGLVFWLNLGSQLFLYSTEVNVVLSRRLWPRSLVGDAAGDAAGKDGDGGGGRDGDARTEVRVGEHGTDAAADLRSAGPPA
ncbi:MAG TPA: YihY/virulence factor BrkB family protein [Acidimicrobiales bacterium]|nr:YihY/virulence factor BrkB family protein [Acidimicrobiales bacterium]